MLAKELRRRAAIRHQLAKIGWRSVALQSGVVLHKPPFRIAGFVMLGEHRDQLPFVEVDLERRSPPEVVLHFVNLPMFLWKEKKTVYDTSALSDSTLPHHLLLAYDNPKLFTVLFLSILCGYIDE